MIAMRNTVERQTEALASAQRHWQERHSAAAAEAVPSAVTIALSREAGTPGTSVARAVGQRLDWPVYDHELLEKIAQEMGLRVSLLESLDERGKSWLLEYAEAFATVPFVSESRYVRHLVETILSLGKLGHCVIVGRGAPHILPPATTLRVRLVGLPEDRITAVASRLGCARAEAARWVEETERERVRFVRDHFLKDPTDPCQYDLVLNASRWSAQECAEMIVQAARCLENRASQRAAPVAMAAAISSL